MPRLSEAKKDVISCEKLWGGANDLWSRDIRMGQPILIKSRYPEWEANVVNWNILVTIGRENNSDSRSSGERTGKSPNQYCYGKIGVIGLRCKKYMYRRTNWKVRPKRVKVPYLKYIYHLAVSWVPRGWRRLVGISQHHLARLNTTERPIAN